MMDIEMAPPMAEAMSGVKPILSSTLPLSQDEFTSLNTALNAISETVFPLQVLQEASNNPTKMNTILFTIFFLVNHQLAETSGKVNFMPPSTITEGKNFIENLSLNDRREWEDAIKTGLQSKDWTDLIAHPTLRRFPLTPMVRTLSETPEEQAKRLHSMFSRKYHGDSHMLFLQGLDDYEKIYDPRKHFGRIISIIQSSGTGKSRMVKEMGSLLPALSICFRKGGSPESGWPPPDEPARCFLLRTRSDKARHKGEELAGAFLGAVMDVIAEKIEARGVSLPPEGYWMSDWHLDSAIDIAESSRHTCFVEVGKRAEKLLVDNSTDIAATRLSSNIAIDAADSAPAWHRRLFNMLCHPAFEKLSQILKARKVKKFLLAFDECSALNDNIPVPIPGVRPDRAPRWGMSLIALQRIIKSYDDFVADVHIWFLLLDTNSSVIDMTPLGKEAPSDRFEKGYRSLPAWPYIGFNQMAEKDVFAVGGKNPTHVHSMQHLKLYGRPYWSTLTDQEVLGVATKKLFSDLGFLPRRKEHVFAAFAVRVGLEIGVGEASERLAMEAVRSHMRILDSVVGSMVITTSPPEPMLAIAAATAMNHSEDTYKIALETLLDELILKGVVLDRGLLGELSSRLLLLQARDKAASDGFVKTDPISKLPIVQPVELSKFLQTLLGDTLGVPEDQRMVRDKLLQEASMVWINFTHFYHMPVSIGEVTESMLVNAWATGVAFQCAHNQPVIDGFIVGYCGSLNEPFQSSSLITIPWQSKAKATAAASMLAQSLTAPFIVPRNGASRYKPWHVVILMDLAAPSAFGKATGPHCDLTRTKAVRPKRGKDGQEVWMSYAKTNESEGERYCLNIRGHRAANYPVLSGLEKEFDILFTRALSCSEPAFVPYAEMMAKAQHGIILD